jgi:tyrosinase
MKSVMRRAAWRDGTADGWHDDLIWYAAGIHQMRALTPGLDDFVQRYLDGDVFGTPEMIAIVRQWDDPRSLGYQSQIHGTFVDKADWPGRNGVAALWKECAHEHWFFLPWHRAYLLEFEAVVRGHIEALGGPADWALPYWDYSDFLAGADRLDLPLPLQGDTLPAGVEVPGVERRADGTFPNPLFNPTRSGPNPAISGAGFAYAGFALLRPHYANQQDTGAVSFGGGVPEDPDNPAVFHGGGEIGMLDAQPHGSVHGAVGGMMNQFETAALDPVFWLHHCNADRLWETYAHDLGHGYPFESGQGTGTAAHQSWTTKEFRFHRSDGTASGWTTVTWKAPDVLDIGALGYGYDTTAAPPFPVAPTPDPASEIDPFGLDAGVPEPVAEAGPVSPVADLEIVLSGGAGADQGLGVDSFPAEARWLLRFDGIRSVLPVPTSYHVFVGVAPGDDADPDDADHYAGLLTLFGVVEASRDDGTSAADGQRRRLDVTAQVTAQTATLRPLAAPLRLVATDPDRDLAAAQLSIERITLEFG